MKNKSLKLMLLCIVGVLVLTSMAVFANGEFRQGKGIHKGMPKGRTFTEVDDFKGGKGIGMPNKKEFTEEEITDMKVERLAKMKEMLDKQVTDGKITQKQADEMYSRCEADDFKGGKGIGMPNKKEFTKGQIRDNFKDKKGFGMFKEKAFNKKELTDEEFADMKAERLAKMKEMLDKQVTDGKITQEQADEMYARCESNDLRNGRNKAFDNYKRN